MLGQSIVFVMTVAWFTRTVAWFTRTDAWFVRSVAWFFTQTKMIGSHIRQTRRVAY